MKAQTAVTGGGTAPWTPVAKALLKTMNVALKFCTLAVMLIMFRSGIVIIKQLRS